MVGKKQVSRRVFVAKAAAFAGLGVAGLGAVASPVSGSSFGPSKSSLSTGAQQDASAARGHHARATARMKKRVICLGFDGMDPDLLLRFVGEGEMPTFKRFMEHNYFGKLATTVPAQSPVAWASFISGTNPGGHGIFDFIHRDPKSMIPHLSISRSSGAARSIDVGQWSIPLGAGTVELMRKGPTLWDVLDQHQVPSSVFQIPSNFPAHADGARLISGMGTPDLAGGYGTSTFITDRDIPGAAHFDGTRVQRVRVIDHQVRTKLVGPPNTLRQGAPDTEIEIVVHRDPSAEIVRIDVAGQTLVARRGEWTGWVPLQFELMPLFASVAGMVRFYVKEVHPRIAIYVTPVNIDPMDPAMPISSPAGYSRSMAEKIGRFYTQGLPADTKGLSLGLLSDDEYLSQAKLVVEENLAALRYQLSDFNEGLLFSYFSSVDQNCHMLMRLSDPTHPQYDPKASSEAKNAVRYFYQRMDEALATALDKVDSDTMLMVLSDHGFGTFRREIHLNTWLYENGFLALKEPLGDNPGELFSLVDWSRTKAYGLGFNGIYLNERGREPNGIVAQEERATIKAEISQKLAQLRDPLNGASAVSRVFDCDEIYRGNYRALSPDLQVGYQRGYRTSDDSVLGKLPKPLVGDRLSKWSSDHCFDPALVPGILLMNQQPAGPRAQTPAIWDLAPTILSTLGLPVPEAMEGVPLTTSQAVN